MGYRVEAHVLKRLGGERRAKAAGRGSVSTIAWLEVTRRGHDATHAFRPLGLDELTVWAPHLTALKEGLATSMLHTMEEQLADSDPEVGMSDALVTLGRKGFGHLAAPPVAGWDLARGLDITRWWMNT